MHEIFSPDSIFIFFLENILITFAIKTVPTMKFYFVILFILISNAFSQDRPRVRDIGLSPGIFQPGRWNAITDIPGVKVGHRTIIRGDSVRTGVTAILPHDQNLFRNKVPAAIYVGNGFGKLAGVTQVEELGNIETPIILTNTLNVGTAVEAVVQYILSLPGNENVRSVNAIVGETNDGFLNDIRGMHVTREDVLVAIQNAQSGPVEEGCVGAGSGTVCFGFKGGIGTSSRKIPASLGGYIVGVLVQTNFGGILTINGVPVGIELGQYAFSRSLKQQGNGSCMIVVATNAPLSSRNLKRLAKRALLGLARTGSFMSNGSGDYVIAFSTAYTIPHRSGQTVNIPPLVPNDKMSALFLAVIEATEEAVYNSLFKATDMKGRDGHAVKALPLQETIKILKKYGRVK
jgi:D-aminopeptidase